MTTAASDSAVAGPDPGDGGAGRGGEHRPLGPGREYARLGPRVWILGGLMLVLGVVTAVLIWTQGLRGSRSYLYLAFYAIPANTAISVFPHEPVVIYFGKIANIWITGGVALAGTLVAAYLDHAVFVPVLNLKGKQGYKDSELYRKAAGWFRRYPFATLVVAAATPVPFWPFKLLSFSLHYPLRRYMVAVALARFPRYVVLAWAGFALDPPTWLLVALFLAILGAYAWKVVPELYRRLRERRRADRERAGTPGTSAAGDQAAPAADGPHPESIPQSDTSGGSG